MAKATKNKKVTKKQRTKSMFKAIRSTSLTKLIVFLVIFASIGTFFIYRGFAAQTSFSGAQKHGVAQGGLQWLPAAERRAKLRSMNALGVRWLKIDITWSDVQPNSKNDWNWAPFDALIDDARNANIGNMSVVADLTYSPKWAIPSGLSSSVLAEKAKWEHYAPRDDTMDEFTLFAAKAAERYKGRVEHFQIWNEANNSEFFAPKPDVVKYVKMLKAGYAGIKYANQNAIVITSGLAPYGEVGQSAPDGSRINPVNFLQAMYFVGAKGYFDAVGWHPYNWGRNNWPNEAKPWNAWYQMYGTNPSARSLMRDNGDSAKKIWMLEWGYPSVKGNIAGSTSVTDETLQAKYLSRGYKLIQDYSWAGPLFWYKYDDNAPVNSIFDVFGLVKSNGAPKPSALIYNAATKGIYSD